MKERINYPFPAVVGQEAVKEALMLNAVCPSIGGVLIRGEKGTAKSTLVRGFADVLPGRKTVDGCRCGCGQDMNELCPECAEKMRKGPLKMSLTPMTVVELPLGSTEDRIKGTIDIEAVITSGKKRFEYGVLAKANGNVLYADEVNLLEDHIVDLLLDAAAMGVNHVEREGISYWHPSRFILVGTMNPEEGDLRPQLLDRFGLTVDVKGETDEGRRAEIIYRRMEFERDPAGFEKRFSKERDSLKELIISARERMNRIMPGKDSVDTAVKISLAFGVDGHRADLTLIKAAAAYAALNGRTGMGPSDVIHVAGPVMSHRMRKDPFGTHGDANEFEERLRSVTETHDEE